MCTLVSILSVTLKSLNDPRQKSCYFDPIFTEVALYYPLFLKIQKIAGKKFVFFQKKKKIVLLDITLEKTLAVMQASFNTSF
jgi:hypothetical protein